MKNEKIMSTWKAFDTFSGEIIECRFREDLLRILREQVKEYKEEYGYAYIYCTMGSSPYDYCIKVVQTKRDY